MLIDFLFIMNFVIYSVMFFIMMVEFEVKKVMLMFMKNGMCLKMFLMMEVLFLIVVSLWF